MNATRSRHAAARIRSLASAGAGGPQLLPTLLEQLGRVLAFDSAAYYHLDELGQPQMLAEDPDVLSVIPTYLDERMQAAERQVARPFTQAAREDFGPQLTTQLITVPYQRFLRSDYYNVLLRPIHIHDCVSLVTRLPDGRPTGALKFYRRTRWAPFRREELAELAGLEHFLAAALQPRDPPESGVVETCGRALLIVTLQGRLLWMSTQAGTLAAQAFGAHWQRGALPAPLQRVLTQLKHARRGNRDATLPLWQWRDQRGHFSVRAVHLEAARGNAESVALEIARHVPRQLAMLQRLALLDLPPRQFQIACRLTGPHSEAQIAADLGITRNTMVYHRRRLYERLAVHSRRELLALLGGPEGPAASA